MPTDIPIADPRTLQLLTDRCHVSRETLGQFEAFAALLHKWNQRINLVSPHSLVHLWERHILDSAQLLCHIPKSARILTDFGSGAGFPGLILALAGVPEVHLVESDARKCAFLAEAATLATQCRITIHNTRIEAATPWKTDIITARALASVQHLLEYSAPFLQKESLCIFAKGCKAREELDEAGESWSFDAALHPSLSGEELPENERGYVVVISKVQSL